MKILIISPFAPGTPRGNSVAVKRLMKGFTQEGHQVDIFTSTEFKENIEGEIFKKDSPPNVVLCLHAYHCSEVLSILKKNCTIPIVLSLRGTDADGMLDSKEKSEYIMRSLLAVDRITVFAEDIRDRIIERTSLSTEKFRIIPNGLDIPSSTIDFRQKLSIPEDAFVFVSLAGLRQVKRPLFPLNCLAKIRKENPEIFFLHAGPALEEKIANEFLYIANKEDWVRHAGSIKHNESDSFLRAGNIFVAASLSEGMPHAVREAMFQGLPCLLSDIPGHRRIAANGIEALFFKDEIDFMRESVILKEDSELRKKLGLNASLKIKNQLSQSGEIKEYLKCFSELKE